MPTYMDRHDDVDITPRGARGGHMMDLSVQAKHGTSYLSYWFDPQARSVFCLVDAPSIEAAEATHARPTARWRRRSSRWRGTS